MTTNKQSPLKAKPLRLPGQSVQDQINDFVSDNIIFPLMVACFLVGWAAYEWAVLLGLMTRPNPIYISVFAGAGLLYLAWKLIRGQKKLKALKQGRDGERAVGQFLEDLRAKGNFVFHDVIGEGFNLDHVVIGPKGIFTIETKTISKPAKGDPKVKYDGNMVTIGGFRPERNPIMQAKGQAGWLKDLIEEETGRKVNVKPVIVYPGWYVEAPTSFQPNVAVINPRQLPAFIEKSSSVLLDTDVHLFKSTLSRHNRKAH